MKTFLSLLDGVITLTENEGAFSLNVGDAASLGGGDAAGVVKANGQASVQLNAETALRLGEALLNSHLPTSVQPLANVIEGVVNQAIKALE